MRLKLVRIPAWMAVCVLAGGAQTVFAAAPPPHVLRSEVESALQKQQSGTEALRQVSILLLWDTKDHKENEHDYPVWQERWALLLGGKSASSAAQVNLYGPPTPVPNNSPVAKNVTVRTARGWPSVEQLATTDVLVAFCYINWTDEHKRDLKAYLERGGGLVLIHSATWTKPKADAEVGKLVGVGGFTRWRHGPLQLEIKLRGHPICKGLPETIFWYDEPYWPPTFPATDGKLEVLAVSSEKLEPQAAQTSPQPMFWAYKKGPGRIFGCVPGHYTWTFDDPWFRCLVLRGIAWAARESPYRFDDLVLSGARVAGHPAR